MLRTVRGAHWYIASILLRPFLNAVSLQSARHGSGEEITTTVGSRIPSMHRPPAMLALLVSFVLETIQRNVLNEQLMRAPIQYE